MSTEGKEEDVTPEDHGGGDWWDRVTRLVLGDRVRPHDEGHTGEIDHLPGNTDTSEVADETDFEVNDSLTSDEKITWSGEKTTWASWSPGATWGD